MAEIPSKEERKRMRQNAIAGSGFIKPWEAGEDVVTLLDALEAAEKERDALRKLIVEAAGACEDNLEMSLAAKIRADFAAIVMS